VYIASHHKFASVYRRCTLFIIIIIIIINDERIISDRPAAP
jgi:hypothetical protein